MTFHGSRENSFAITSRIGVPLTLLETTIRAQQCVLA